MPGKNKHPLLGWHCPAELAAWARSEAGRRDVKLSVVLTEALEQYRRRNSYPSRPLPQEPEVVTARPKPSKAATAPAMGYSKERQARGRR